MKDLKKIIGTRIKAIRKARGLSQEELADAIGRSVFTISQIERGVNFPKLDTLVDLANGLDCELDKIVARGSGGKGISRVAAERARIEEDIWANLEVLDLQMLRVARAAIAAMASSRPKE